MRSPSSTTLALASLLFTGFFAEHDEVRAQPPASAIAGLPSLDPPYPLPPLPRESPRNANYTIAARLDAKKHTIDGRLVLEWRNLGDRPVATFPFHLYWNAFRNNLSTSAREGGSRGSGRGTDPQERDFGWIHVTTVRLLDDGSSGSGPAAPSEVGTPPDESGSAAADLLPTLHYVQPDDANPDDRTVVEVKTPRPVAPGATARFLLEWTSLIPHGTVGRAGWVHDYHFIVQWFPKLGVFWNGSLSANQFHSVTEFFSDYGRYDVSLTLPRGFVVGATGQRVEGRDNGDGTETLRYVQDDVHDFAWTASPRFLEKTDRFEEAGYPKVDIRLLVQPEHEHLSRRYLEATKTALRTYGAWSAPYPYAQITVVDPAWNSPSGGMEYPTLFTGGTHIFAPEILHSPEEVTVHEAGHQFWYGLVGNNEFEEAWLDEGFNSYHEEKSTALWLGPKGWGRTYFRPAGGRGSRTGFPVVAPGVLQGRGIGDLDGLREAGKTDAMARRGWEYRNRRSYGLNSYGKPALSLQTLEALVGDETMTRIMRVYARRFRFAHPTSADFIATVNEVTGQDWRWYFEATWFSSDLCDYAISVKNEPVRKLTGFRDARTGPPERVPAAKDEDRDDEGPWESEVTVERRGEVRLPVEIRLVFADGSSRDERWDGQYRWTRFKHPKKVVRAYVDPDHKIALDVDPGNNSWVDEKGQARRAATKWSARFLFWLQNLLELHTVLG